MAANVTAIVTSVGERGAYKISTILPWIFPIIKDDEECEKACWIICIAINPGARKLINEKPSISDLLLPIATERTNRNNKKKQQIQRAQRAWKSQIIHQIQLNSSSRSTNNP